jgi:RNA 2',3'-cyclic 3'-phosphodiesterase
LRPVRPEALHVTLVFLGWQDESAADAIAEAAFGAAASGRPAPRLAPAELRPLPPRNPRLFALSLEDEEDRAGALQDLVASALEAGRWYRPEKRPFWPHITLARVKRGERRVEALEGPAPPDTPFDAAALTLYRSTLRPQGALYEPLARREL